MKKRVISLASVAAVVLFGAYLCSYLVLVRQAPIDLRPIHGGYYVYQYYLVGGQVGGWRSDAADWFFFPANWLDRRVRRGLWKTAESGSTKPPWKHLPVGGVIERR
jgi:hypothetical protein